MHRFEWDHAKNRSNIEKHGVDFRGASRVFQDLDHFERLALVDEIREIRRIAIGSDGFDVLAVVCTDRADRIRIISARRASNACNGI